MAGSPARTARRAAERAAREAEARRQAEAAQAAAEPTPPAPAPVVPAPVLPPPQKPDDAGEVDFTVMPPGLLLPEESTPIGRDKTVRMSPELEAYWQMFVMLNPDMKVFNKTIQALMRLVLREQAKAVAKARAESRELGVPVRPETPPLVKKLRKERRLIQFEEREARNTG